MEKIEEQTIFQIILHSGTARAESYKALKESREGNCIKSESSLQKAKEELDEAHKIHRELLSNPEIISSSPSLLMVHAQDHLMTALAENTLIIEMNELIKTNREILEKIKKLEERCQ